ncbi:MAG: hypothetical protein KGL39_00450 [Patescibacteria group bacterium]|nr:hypothetical protein [Patescibacteria group bacterium]
MNDVPLKVIEGISFMFEIIGSRIGDRMDYLDSEERDKIRDVAKWLAKMRALIAWEKGQ